MPVTLGTASLSGGVATLVVPAGWASNGTYSLQAAYGGSSTHAASTSAAYSHVVSAGPAFQGVGDITTAANWLAWGGMRAFTAAQAATPTGALTLVFLDSTGITYNTKTDGSINFSTYTADSVAHGLPLGGITWRDQTTNANHQVLAAGGTTPTFSLTAGPNSGPCLTDTSSNSLLESTNNITRAQPLSFWAVAKANGSQAVTIIGQAGGTVKGAVFNSPDEWYVYAGGAVGQANTGASPNNWHTGVLIANGTSSNCYVDGVDGTGAGDIGSGAFSATKLNIFGDVTSHFHGSIVEWGLYAGDLSAVRSALNANARAFYGF